MTDCPSSFEEGSFAAANGGHGQSSPPDSGGAGALATGVVTGKRFDSFPHLAASWRAGVVRYDVDFAARTVTYYGCNGEEYIEAYPSVEM